MDAGVKVCKSGADIYEIGHAIANIYEPHGYDSVREFSGHGIGQIFHRGNYY